MAKSFSALFHEDSLSSVLQFANAGANESIELRTASSAGIPNAAEAKTGAAEAEVSFICRHYSFGH